MNLVVRMVDSIWKVLFLLVIVIVIVLGEGVAWSQATNPTSATPTGGVSGWQWSNVTLLCRRATRPFLRVMVRKSRRNA